MEAIAPLLRRLCFVDIETTGLDPASEEIVEIGAVFVERGVVTARRRWLVRPTRAIPPLITALTGLTVAEVADAPPLASVDAEIQTALDGWTLVAHNGGFERSFLGARIAGNPLLDSCEVAQLLFPERPSHSLDALVRWLGVGPGARHRALDDAEDTFQMLAALCERFVGEGDAAQLEALLRHLRPGVSADRAALCTLFDELLTAMRGRKGSRVPAPVTPAPRSPFVERMAGWLRAPTFVCAELERDALPEAALDAARLASGEELVAVSVPGPLFRELANRADVPAIAQRPVCGPALRAALATLGTDELEQFGRAYLSAWLHRTRTGDLQSVSGFVRSRAESVAAALEAASTCGCDDGDCFTRAAQAAHGWVVVTHEHALEWMERGVPARHLVVDADRLPDTERRRLQRSLDLAYLDDFGGLDAHLQELRAALAAHPEGQVTMRERALPPWLAVREALMQLAHALRDQVASDARAARLLARVLDVLDPPPPGFELFVTPDALIRTPARPAERVTRRLSRGMCLLSSFLGGTAWTQASALTVPTTRSPRLEWISGATPLAALASLVSATGARAVVMPGPLDPLAEALLAAGHAVSLGADRPGAVRLYEWRRESVLPEAGTYLFYGVKDWRRAVLSVRAERVVLASPTGLPAEPLRRALRGLDPHAVTC